MSYLVAALVVLATALVTALETAVSRLSPARVAELVDDQPERYRALARLVEAKPKYVNALRLLEALGWAGTTVCVELAMAATPGLQGASVLWALLVSAAIGFVVFGVGATTLGRQHADDIARAAAPLIRLIATLLAPVVRLLILLGNAITPGKGLAEGPFASAAEMRELLDQVDASVLEDDERRMIHSVFELGDTVAREVMVPRTEMVWIERHKTLRQAISLALRSGYSRIPVVGEDVDDIVGVIYLKDVTRRVFEHADAQQSERVESLMRPAMFAPESKRADDLLREMQAARTHLVVLIDEYGGTAGLVTIEDVLEEIVGEISDEYDTAAAEVEELADGNYRVSARLHIEDLAELIGIELDSDEEGIDTVAGLLAARLGRVALPGSEIELNGWRITAQSVAGRRNKVDSVLVAKIENVESSDV